MEPNNYLRSHQSAIKFINVPIKYSKQDLKAIFSQIAEISSIKFISPTNQELDSHDVIMTLSNRNSAKSIIQSNPHFIGKIQYHPELYINENQYLIQRSNMGEIIPILKIRGIPFGIKIEELKESIQKYALVESVEMINTSGQDSFQEAKMKMKSLTDTSKILQVSQIPYQKYVFIITEYEEINSLEFCDSNSVSDISERNRLQVRPLNPMQKSQESLGLVSEDENRENYNLLEINQQEDIHQNRQTPSVNESHSEVEEHQADSNFEEDDYEDDEFSESDYEENDDEMFDGEQGDSLDEEDDDLARSEFSDSSQEDGENLRFNLDYALKPEAIFYPQAYQNFEPQRLSSKVLRSINGIKVLKAHRIILRKDQLPEKIPGDVRRRNNNGNLVLTINHEHSDYICNLVGSDFLNPMNNSSEQQTNDDIPFNLRNFIPNQNGWVSDNFEEEKNNEEEEEEEEEKIDILPRDQHFGPANHFGNVRRTAGIDELAINEAGITRYGPNFARPMNQFIGDQQEDDAPTIEIKQTVTTKYAISNDGKIFTGTVNEVNVWGTHPHNDNLDENDDYI